MLFTLLAFIVAIGVLVTFHELGHYWVARRCGVKILRFSVGFGKVVARRTDRHGTEWALSAIPLGGYVKMLDDPLPGQSSSMAFNHKPLGQRFAIVAAGPAANFILAAVLYAALGWMGASEPAAILAEPAPGTPAAAAGVRQGDAIQSVGSAPVRSWNDARWELLDAATAGGRLVLNVTTAQGFPRERILDVPAADIQPDGADLMAQIGLELAPALPRVTVVNPGSPGEQAGLQQGDIVVRVGELDNPTSASMVDEVQRHPEQALTLHVLRDGTPISLVVTPAPHTADDGRIVGRIGVMLGSDIPMVDVRYGPLQGLVHGITRTWDTTVLSLKMMGRMLTGDISVRNVSGPVTIADYAGQTARIGLASYLSFMALISVSIGVLNLLPVPMLDGGHLLFYTIEALRGKPLSERILEQSQRIGLGLLAGLMGLAFFNDFTRLFS